MHLVSTSARVAISIMQLPAPAAVTPITCLQLLGENAAKISNFASYLRSVFRTDTDPTTLEVAAATLGHLVQTGGALTADVVEYEVCPPLHIFQSMLCTITQHSTQSVCWCHRRLDARSTVYIESADVMEF